MRSGQNVIASSTKYVRVLNATKTARPTTISTNESKSNAKSYAGQQLCGSRLLNEQSELFIQIISELKSSPPPSLKKRQSINSKLRQHQSNDQNQRHVSHLFQKLYLFHKKKTFTSTRVQKYSFHYFSPSNWFQIIVSVRHFLYLKYLSISTGTLEKSTKFSKIEE